MSSVSFNLAGTNPLATEPFPVSLTAQETLRIAGLLPVVFRQQKANWEAVCLLESVSMKVPALDPLGRLRTDYVPTLLRLRPFVRQEDGRFLGSWDIDALSPLLSTNQGIPLLDSQTGQASTGLLGILADLERVNRSMAQLSEAIANLASASLVKPIDEVFSFRHARGVQGLYAVDAHSLMSLPPPALAQLARGRLSSLDVAVAALFSMRWADGEFREASRLSIDESLEALADALRKQEKEAGQAGSPGSPARPAPQSTKTSIQYTVDDDVLLDFEGL